MSKSVEIEEQHGLIVVPEDVSPTGKRKALLYSVMLINKPRKNEQSLYGGRIISLVIRDAGTGKVLADYDKGWLLEPRSTDAEIVIGVLLLDIDGVQYDDVK